MLLRGTVFSQTLEMDTGITVVTPSRFEPEECRAAYLLHGLCGNSDTWVDYSMLPVYAAGGKTVYILPEAGRSFYTDMTYGGRYFTYLTEELPELCRSLFRVSARREDTAVIGCSMGGYGALKCALSKPERYGMCAAFSSACLFLEEGLEDQRKNGDTPEFLARYGENIPRDFVAIFGEQLVCRPGDEILPLADRAAKEGTLPALFLTCGSWDPFLRDHQRFTGELKKREIPFAYEEWEGGHDFDFFNASLKKAIDTFQL